MLIKIPSFHNHLQKMKIYCIKIMLLIILRIFIQINQVKFFFICFLVYEDSLDENSIYNIPKVKNNLLNSNSFSCGNKGTGTKSFEYQDNLKYLNEINHNYSNRNLISNNFFEENNNIIPNNSFDENYFIKMNINLNINAEPYTESKIFIFLYFSLPKWKFKTKLNKMNLL